jgi:uncharacterized protein YbcI
MLMPELLAQHRGSASAAISNACVRLFRESTGRGPTKAKTVISRDLVTVVLQDTMTAVERTLVAGDHSDEVLHLRRQVQQLMRDNLIAAIEINLERKVIAFMSDNHIEPDIAVEVFVLEQEDEDSSTE